MLKTSVITSSWEKMLIRSDSKQRDVLNREKHGFPCRDLQFFARFPRHLGFIIQVTVMAKGDEREVGFQDGGCFLKVLKREQINNRTFIAFLNWD